MRIDVLIFRWWMYGDKVLDEEQTKGSNVKSPYFLHFIYSSYTILKNVFVSLYACLAGLRVRGWFPRRCVEKCHYDSATNTPACEQKKDK